MIRSGHCQSIAKCFFFCNWLKFGIDMHPKEANRMTKRTIGIVFLISLAAITLAQKPASPRTHLKIGDRAPDFVLYDAAGKEIKLNDFRGKKNVVLAFYVFAFSGG